jgi:hypothetical protein
MLNHSKEIAVTKETTQEKLDLIIALLSESAEASQHALNLAEQAASRADYSANATRHAIEAVRSLAVQSLPVDKVVKQEPAEELRKIKQTIGEIIYRKEKVTIEYVFGDGLWVINGRLGLGLLANSLDEYVKESGADNG